MGEVKSAFASGDFSQWAVCHMGTGIVGYRGRRGRELWFVEVKAAFTRSVNSLQDASRRSRQLMRDFQNGLCVTWGQVSWGMETGGEGVKSAFAL